MREQGIKLIGLFLDLSQALKLFSGYSKIESLLCDQVEPCYDTNRRLGELFVP